MERVESILTKIVNNGNHPSLSFHVRDPYQPSKGPFLNRKDPSDGRQVRPQFLQISLENLPPNPGEILDQGLSKITEIGRPVKERLPFSWTRL